MKKQITAVAAALLISMGGMSTAVAGSHSHGGYGNKSHSHSRYHKPVRHSHYHCHKRLVYGHWKKVCHRGRHLAKGRHHGHSYH
ncbi:MAG: hypothetical protein AB8B49_10890 [Nitratireductor sp.]